MLLRTVIIIFALFLTIVFANSQEKYIDLLPDEEKQDFLNNIARRVMQTVERNGTNNENVELADKQLKKHNSYFQSVMEHETGVFGARRNKKEDRLSEEDIKKTKENDDLEVKPVKFRDDEVDTFKADNIDFAVTGMNRHSYDEISQDNFADTSDTDNVMENTLPLQGRPITRDVNSAEPIKEFNIKNSNEKEENVNNHEVLTLNSEMQIHESHLVKSTTETEDLKIEITNTLATVFKNIPKFETSSVTSSLTEIDNVSTETPTGSKIQILEYDSLNKSNPIYLITEKNFYLGNNFVPSSNATESYSQYGSDITLTSSLTDKSTVHPVLNTATNESTDVTTTVNSQIFTTMTQNTAEVNIATTENYSAVTEDRSAKETITKTTTLTPIITTSNNDEEQNTKKPKKIKLGKTIKQLENDNFVSYVVSKALKNIKHELGLKKKGKFIENEKKTNKGNKHLNNYQVYEIPWPINGDNQSFLRNQEPIKDQPYFIPVHVHPKNRLGPHEMEENLKELDTRNLCEGNNDAHDKAEPREFKLQLNNEMRKFVHLHKRRTTTTTAMPSWDILLNPLMNLLNHKRSTTTPAPNKHSETTDKETSDLELNILGVRKEKDVFIKQARLKGFGLPSLMRSKIESKVNIYMNVLKDLILEDNKSLKQYDWLTTTVQIQSALSKILKLIKRVTQSKQLYPVDLQILRYMVFLYNFSLEVKKENKKLSDKLKKRVLRKNTLLKEKNLIKREEDELSNLYKFMIDVRDGLFDLHEAIKHIADVTKFDRQNWYGNLKLYLSADEKHLRELLLHISMSRLIDLVDHSCKQSLDHDFIQFVKTNKKDAKMIVEEMIFINDIVHEILINKG